MFTVLDLMTLIFHVEEKPREENPCTYEKLFNIIEIREKPSGTLNF